LQRGFRPDDILANDNTKLHTLAIGEMRMLEALGVKLFFRIWGLGQDT
jgi:hypothetical protein